MNRRLLRSSLAAFVVGAASAVALPAAADLEPPPASEAAPRSDDNDDDKKDDKKKEEARFHFRAGVNLLQDPDQPRYDEAYAEFKRAYALAPSPVMLGNMGLCAMKLERDAEAIEAYTRYLTEVDDLDPAERAQAERDLVTLKAGLALITVESRPNGAIVRDTRTPVRGEPITNTYGPLHGALRLGVRRGHHLLTARFADGTESSWELDVNGGESHLFEPPAREVARPASPPVAEVQVKRPIPPAVYIGGIATGALALGTIATGALAVNARSDFEAANDGTSRSHASELRDKTQTLNVVADVCLGATVVAAAVTTYFYLTRPAVRTANRAVSIGIVVGPTGVAGRF